MSSEAEQAFEEYLREEFEWDQIKLITGQGKEDMKSTFLAGRESANREGVIDEATRNLIGRVEYSLGTTAMNYKKFYEDVKGLCELARQALKTSSTLATKPQEQRKV